MTAPTLMDAYAAAVDAKSAELSFRDQVGATTAEVVRARRSGNADKLKVAVEAREAAIAALRSAVIEHDARLAVLQAIDARTGGRARRRSAIAQAIPRSKASRHA